MRRMAARHHEAPDRAAHLDAIKLVQRAVRVLGALDEQRGRRDALGLLLEAPRAESRIQPDAAPTPDGGVGVVVMSRPMRSRSPSASNALRVSAIAATVTSST